MTDLSAWLATAESWLAAHAERRPPPASLRWGEGSDRVSVFRDQSPDEERRLIEGGQLWQRTKYDAGYGAISWPPEYGGAGLSREHEEGFARLEAEFATPARHEAVAITLDLVGPTILAVGTDEQRSRYLPPLRRGDELWCQLFSEPGAGSDLASLRCRARRSDGGWVLDGQKVWTSGAHAADFGYLLARTSEEPDRHRGITAFLLPMRARGVEARPLRQMTGGASFNEVFLTEVALPDSSRLGGEGEGWRVAMTTLGFERAAATVKGTSGDEHVRRLALLARRRGRHDDPIARQRLAAALGEARLRSVTWQRSQAARQATGVPGPEGSVGKLAWTAGLEDVADLASTLAGPAVQADTGEWGAFAWSELISGVPGARIAGGTDEIQRTIVAERSLGLPR